ncbi:MAG TPA: iron-sulfur cluster assembly scaffold protein [Woeseiaceae bacterium]|nr:iron-sulfur cluster assembly scaffold protein [Woeseiaceae bacterium]
MDGAYSDEVRRLFADPAHAGDLPPGGSRTASVEVSESAAGCRVRLSASGNAGRLSAVRFRAFGCPHLLAAAEAFCAEVEGQPVTALLARRVPALMERLAVPVEKTGRLLLLEDAAKALARELLEDSSDGTNDTQT